MNDQNVVVISNVTTIEIPENKFEAIVFLKNLKEKLNETIHYIDNSIQDRCDNLIRSNTIEDENYKLVPVFSNRKTSTLDESKFKEEMPEAYRNSLTIKSTEAEKIIGKDNLKKLIIESYGWGIFEENSNCTLTEARKNIPKAMQEKYISEAYQQIGMDVIRK